MIPPEGLFRDKRFHSLPGTGQAIVLRIALRTNGEGFCWPSIGSLCRDFGISDRSVQRSLMSAIKTGLIIRIVQAGHSNTFKLGVLTPDVDVTPTPASPRRRCHPTPDVDVTPTPDAGVTHNIKVNIKGSKKTPDPLPPSAQDQEPALSLGTRSREPESIQINAGNEVLSSEKQGEECPRQSLSQKGADFSVGTQQPWDRDSFYLRIVKLLPIIDRHPTDHRKGFPAYLGAVRVIGKDLLLKRAQAYSKLFGEGKISKPKASHWWFIDGPQTWERDWGNENQKFVPLVIDSEALERDRQERIRKMQDTFNKIRRQA